MPERVAFPAFFMALMLSRRRCARPGYNLTRSPAMQSNAGNAQTFLFGSNTHSAASITIAYRLFHPTIDSSSTHSATPTTDNAR